MKTIKTNIIILILILASFTSFAQTMQQDTILANKYFEKASIFKDSTQYDSAIVYFEKASVLYEKNEMWRKYLISETRHGNCFEKLWQLDQAIATIKPAIDNFLLYNDENDTIVADAYNILGFQYHYKSQYDSVLICWEKTLQIRKNKFGNIHIKVASIYINLGRIYGDINNFEKAIRYAHTGIEIVKETAGNEHRYIANGYNNLGGEYFDLELYDSALVYFEKSLIIDKKLTEEEDIHIAKIYYNLGNVYGYKNQFNKSLYYYFLAKNLFIKLRGKNNILVAPDLKKH